MLGFGDYPSLGTLQMMLLEQVHCSERKYYEVTKMIYFKIVNLLIKSVIPWKTIFDGRRPLMDDARRRKTTFDGRQPLMEDNL